MYEGALETLAAGVRTSDLGGHAGTTEFTTAVVDRVRTKLEVWSSLGSLTRPAPPSGGPLRCPASHEAAPGLLRSHDPAPGFPRCRDRGHALPRPRPWAPALPRPYPQFARSVASRIARETAA